MIEQYLRRFGVELKRGRTGLCPLPGHIHHNMTPSFSVYGRNGKEYWQCFGSCNRWGDFIDLVGEMCIPGYDRRIHRQDAEAMINDIPESKMIVSKKQKVFLESNLWERFLPIHPKVRAYLNGRGINDETIEKYKLGSCKYIEGQKVDKGNDTIVSIPVFMLNTLTSVKLRHINKKAYFSVEGSQCSIFQYDEIMYSTEPIIISKGEICSMIMSQNGFLNACITGGERAKDLLPMLKKAVSLSKKVVVVGDNDIVGIHAASEKALALGCTAKFPPKEFKDWDAWAIQDPEAIEITRGWLYEG